MPRWPIPEGTARLIVGGRPELVIEDRGASCARSTRFRAFLRGRTLGGYMTGHGPTREKAIEDLREAYTQALGHVDAGADELRRIKARR